MAVPNEVDTSAVDAKPEELVAYVAVPMPASVPASASGPVTAMSRPFETRTPASPAP